MKYATVCSGIEAPTVAWHPLGWEATFYSEIEPFPCAVLSHHYPKVPNYGDMTKFKEWPDHELDLICAGTPCQAFSVAGLRKGLDDPRGNLTLIFLGVLERYRPRWVVWENVPGVHSAISHEAPDICPPEIPLGMVPDGTEMETEDQYDSEEVHAFNCFLAGLSELGYGFAYRILDAQYAGVPQRRRRVFVVGYLGNWRYPAAVLFERESLCGNPPPSREKGERTAPTISARTKGGGGLGTDAECGGALIASQSGKGFWREGVGTVTRQNYKDGNAAGLVAHSLRAEGFDASEDGTGRGVPLVAGTIDSGAGRRRGAGIPPETVVAFQPKASRTQSMNPSELCPTIGITKSPAVAFTLHGADKTVSTATKTDIAGSVRTKPPGSIENSSTTAVMQGMAVRRLTPRECERLQGFPDDYTLIPYRGKPAADGPRYKALGNSMAVPEVRWIGKRIEMMEAIVKTECPDSGRRHTDSDIWKTGQYARSTRVGAPGKETA